MKTTYKHLSQDQRVSLLVLKLQGMSLREIAKSLGVHHTSLSRELKRNRYNKPFPHHYHPRRAHERSLSRKQRAGTRPRLKNPLIRDYVFQKIKLGWSPELIAGRISRDLPRDSISHEAIYQFIYSSEKKLIPFLARRHSRRKRKAFPRTPKKVPIPERVLINERPPEINSRRQFGHWEADSMVSRASRTSLHVLLERQSRLLKITKIPANSSKYVQAAILHRLTHQPSKMRRSITYDNGLENVHHLTINRYLKTRSYFCNPYHSWEKGSVENSIGIIRRFIPKKTNLQLIPATEISRLENLINNRPRKCLNYHTPNEVFQHTLTGALPH